MLLIERVQSQIRGKTLAQVEQLKLNQGNLFALLGPNGAGKTSLLRSISGDSGYQGSIQLHGREIKSWSALDRARHVGVLPQSSNLTFQFSAEEVVALGLTPLSLPKCEAKVAVHQKMELTDCAHLAKQPYPSLSGGERQRVQLARVLLQVSQAEETPLLLLDEPTSAQDLGQQHHLMNLVQALTQEQGYGVLTILHDLNQVLRYCDQCAVMASGEVKLQGNPQQVLDPITVEQFWDYSPEVLTGHGRQVLI